MEAGHSLGDSLDHPGTTGARKGRDSSLSSLSVAPQLSWPQGLPASRSLQSHSLRKVVLPKSQCRGSRWVSFVPGRQCLSWGKWSPARPPAWKR